LSFVLTPLDSRRLRKAKGPLGKSLASGPRISYKCFSYPHSPADTLTV